MTATATHIIAADIGNSRMKFARFVLSGEETLAGELPQPEEVLSLTPDSLIELQTWLQQPTWNGAQLVIGSVQRTRTADLVDWLRKHDFAGNVQLLAARDLPLVINLPQPERVGMDRLLAAVAVNAIRSPGSAAVIVDLGTAITVDLLSTDGAYQGGAIAPGLAISAKALHDATDALPEFDVATLNDTIEPIGRDTLAAMRSGLFLGAVGAIRELIMRQVDAISSGEKVCYEVYVCGGFGQQVAHLLSADATYMPHLIPQGIAVTVRGAQG